MSLLFKNYNCVLEGRFKGAYLMIDRTNGRLTFDNCIICRENIIGIKYINKQYIASVPYHIIKITWKDNTESLCRFTNEHLRTVISELQGTRKPYTPADGLKDGLLDALKELF